MRHTIIVTSMLLGMSGAIALASPDGAPPDTWSRRTFGTEPPNLRPGPWAWAADMSDIETDFPRQSPRGATIPAIGPRSAPTRARHTPLQAGPPPVRALDLATPRRDTAAIPTATQRRP
jgi:hypothetical protein